MKFFLATAFALVPATVAHSASFATYGDRSLFNSEVGASIFDDYTAPGYMSGDISNNPWHDVHSDAHMSAVLGETTYLTTGHLNSNMINSYNTRSDYCAGCNGSFLLSFGSTSVIGEDGVYGVGLNIKYNIISPGSTYALWDSSGRQTYTAYVIFGDGTATNIALPPVFTLSANGGLHPLGDIDNSYPNDYVFWGISSLDEIVSIHLGGPNAAITTQSAFVLGGITIAAAPVPIPPTAWSLGSGLLLALGWSTARQKS